MMTRNILFVLLVLLLQVVTPEVIPLEIVLDATSDEVHYIKGFLEAPSFMDLSEMRFVTTVSPSFERTDDFYNDYDDDTEGNETPFPTPEPQDDDSGGEVESESEAPTPGPEEKDTDSPTPAPADDTPPDTDAPTPAGGDDTGDVDGNGDGDDSGGDGNDTGDGDGDVASEAPTPDSGNGADGDGDGDGDGDNGDLVETDAPTPADGDGSNGDGDGSDAETDAPTDAPTPSDGGDRVRILDESGGGRSQRTTQILDFVVFLLPENCVKNSFGTCSWADLGVGVVDHEVEGDTSYCCSEDTISRNLCDADDLGKMIVNHEIFVGDHRTIEVPMESNKEFFLDNGVWKQEVSGDWIMVIGNCDDYGLDVLAVGNMEWKSLRGNLPGDMYDLMLFYVGMTILYFLLVIWYGCGMRMYQEAAIPIQKYIAATMVLGLLELFFRSLDLGVWNAMRLRNDNIAYISLTLGVLKRGISRCLGVMVAMGWGVVRDTLGGTLVKIVFLGLLYSGLTLFRDIFVVVAENKVETISVSAEEELIDFALLLTPMIIVINLIFYFWIIRSLNSTTEYLQNMNQTTKLQRHSRLRCIFILSLSIAGIWLIFTIYDVFFDVLSTDQMWILEGVMHINYLFLLSGVAFLWRPNPNAKDYAMQLELPAFGEDDENELELSCVVPSAGDMDDGNDPDHPNGLKVDGGFAS